MSYNSYMKRATLTETKNRLSALIDEVKEGETILVLERGRPVARIEPTLSGSEVVGRLERLERKGLMRRALEEPPTELLGQRPPKAKPGASVLGELLAERRAGR